jgi:ParB family chromosome partitioning protein
MIRALVAAAGMTGTMRDKARPPKAPKRTGSDAVIIHSGSGAPLLRVDAKDRRGVTVTLFHKGGGERSEVEAALRDLLDNHWPAG